MFVIYWHNILPRSLGVWDDTLPRITTESFERQISWISRHFTPFTLPDILDPQATFDSSKRHLAITFDDGFLGVKNHALPILEKYSWTGTVFVLNSSTRSTLMHAERLEIFFRLTGVESFGGFPLTDDSEKAAAYRRTKVQMQPMNPPERTAFCQKVAMDLKVNESEMDFFAGQHPEIYGKLETRDYETLERAGWTIGSHTSNHPHLTQMELIEVRSEIGVASSCCRPESPRLFAYPYGDSDPQIAREVESAGYDAAFTTDPRLIRTDDDRFLLPRMSFGQLWSRAEKKFKRRRR